MAAIITTKQAVAALNEFGSEFIAAKCVKSDMSDLGTPDVFANLPIPMDLHVVHGAKLKNAVTAAGYKRHYPDVEDHTIEVTFLQRDLPTLELSWKTLAGKTIVFLAGLSRTDIDTAGKRQYVLAGPCLVDPLLDWKIMGNQVKFTLQIQPCATAYGGLTSGDATALGALATPPPTTLVAADGAMSAYEFLTLFEA